MVMDWFGIDFIEPNSSAQIPWSSGLAKLCLVVTDEKGLASQQPASSQPTILNIGPSPAPKGWNTVFVRFCGLRWVSWSLFYGALFLNCSSWAIWVESSHKSKQPSMLFHAFASWFCTKVADLPFLSFFKKYLFNRKLRYFAQLHFAYLLWQAVGAIL